MKENRAVSILTILVGLFCINYVFFFPHAQKLIGPESENILVRYFAPILLVNGGIYFCFLGIMFWLGLMVPYYKAGKLEKAKHEFWGTLVASPLLITAGAVVVSSENTKWKLIVILFLSFFLYNLYSGYTFLRKHKRT